MSPREIWMSLIKKDVKNNRKDWTTNSEKPKKTKNKL